MGAKELLGIERPIWLAELDMLFWRDLAKGMVSNHVLYSTQRLTEGLSAVFGGLTLENLEIRP